LEVSTFSQLWRLVYQFLLIFLVLGFDPYFLIHSFLAFRSFLWLILRSWSTLKIWVILRSQHKWRTHAASTVLNRGVKMRIQLLLLRFSVIRVFDNWWWIQMLEGFTLVLCHIESIKFWRCCLAGVMNSLVSYTILLLLSVKRVSIFGAKSCVFFSLVLYFHIDWSVSQVKFGMLNIVNFLLTSLGVAVNALRLAMTTTKDRPLSLNIFWLCLSIVWSSQGMVWAWILRFIMNLILWLRWLLGSRRILWRLNWTSGLKICSVLTIVTSFAS
jgi:hypothetical protein